MKFYVGAPKLVVKPDLEWPAFCDAKGVHPAYAKFGPAFQAGAFWDPRDKCIYVRESDKRNVKLLAHECGHAVDYYRNDHPTTVWAGLLHAVTVGFDVRAFTRLLRWRTAPAELMDMARSIAGLPE